MIKFTSHQEFQIRGKCRVGKHAAAGFCRSNIMFHGEGEQMDDLFRTVTHHISPKDSSCIVIAQVMGIKNSATRAKRAANILINEAVQPATVQ